MPQGGIMPGTRGGPEADAASHAQPATDPFGALATGPDAMMSFWTNWLGNVSGAGGDHGQGMPPWWTMAPESVTDGAVAAGMKQLNLALASHPVLGAVDKMWNANPLREVVPVDWAGIAHALRVVWLRSMSDPGAAMSAAVEFNASAIRSAAETWNDAARRFWFGAEPAAPVGAKAAAGDKRFSAPEWDGNPVFRTLRDLYLMASDFLLRHGCDDTMDAAERQRINFHLRQFIDATSPSLLLMTNPVALRRAFETGGASIADGARNLMHDLKEGRLSMVDAEAFAPGRNLAMAPGKVVYRNKLIELIQYAPTTEKVHAIPLLVMPPWINKFYILDMQPKNSLVRFLVGKGFSVFMVSWKNPDAAMEDTTIEDYMDLGPLAASDAIREITGSHVVNVMGYCIAGTLLAMTLAWLAKKRDTRFNSATFMVSMQDFAKVGDTAVFSDEPAVDLIEQQMLERGYLDSREMSNMFNLLRSNDLIWSNVVNNYLLGQKPPAFDLLYWNSDGTRMARAAHSWYLRNTYLENNLIHPGKVSLKGEHLDLGDVRLDAYAVGAEKDHIVPWESAWRITRLFGGPVRFVLASSGHIAGIINPPGGKGSFWVNATTTPAATTAEQWKETAARHDGSWWTDWAAWLDARSGDRIAPPTMGSAAHPPLDDAPGRYVLEM
jgi:polyhydroxyalkanoate synthase